MFTVGPPGELERSTTSNLPNPVPSRLYPYSWLATNSYRRAQHQHLSPPVTSLTPLEHPHFQKQNIPLRWKEKTIGTFGTLTFLSVRNQPDKSSK